MRQPVYLVAISEAERAVLDGVSQSLDCLWQLSRVLGLDLQQLDDQATLVRDLGQRSLQPDRYMSVGGER